MVGFSSGLEAPACRLMVPFKLGSFCGLIFPTSHDSIYQKAQEISATAEQNHSAAPDLPAPQYLGDGVEGVGALGGVEVGVEDPPGQLAADQHRLHRLAHGLFGAQRQVEAALRTALAEGDVVFDVHGDGHQAGGRTRRRNE